MHLYPKQNLLKTTAFLFISFRMTRWKLEVFKMAMCVSFPVACFYLFNKPELFKDSVIKHREKYFPPIDKAGVCRFY
jgi:hypothetical protein